MGNLKTKHRTVSFRNLMQRRVHEILLVASLYDAFKLEEDGRLTELIFSEYQDMNLTNAPHVTRVSTASHALEKIDKGRFDIVITMSRISNMNTHEFGMNVKALDPDLPVILLVASNKEHRHFIQHQTPENKFAINKVFFWSGDSAVLIAIIKHCEDLWNAERDIKQGLVMAIIVVEDSPQYYSAFLPMIYKVITRHTYRMMNLEYSGNLRLLRMRSRPKILLATTYEEAMSYFKAYQKNVLAVISDIQYPLNGKVDKTAGLKLLNEIKSKEKYVPLVLQSKNIERQADAKANKVRFFDKNSPHLIHDLRTFVIKYCGFKDLLFHGKDNQDGTRVNNILSLEKALSHVPPESIEYHAKRNLFSNWLAVRGYSRLASEIRQLNNLKDIEKLRIDIIDLIEKHRKLRHSDGILNYNPDSYDPDTKYVRFGGGSLGGKARGLAFMAVFLKRFDWKNRYPEIEIQVPKTAFVGTDIFDDFIEENQIHEKLHLEMCDAEINELFQSGDFNPELVKDLMTYLEYNQQPLAVRSSSLLEDSVFQPFAGIFDTFMIPNCNEDMDIRLNHLLTAMKLVYASTFHKKSQSYMKTTGNRIDDEKMGIVIQNVVGKQYDDYFYPTFSGTLQTYNFYPVDKINRENGIANVALGLGRTIANGEKSLRFSPSFPKALLQYYNVDSIFQNSQSKFYAINLKNDNKILSGKEDDNLKHLPLQEAEAHGTLDTVASVYSFDDSRFKESLQEKGPRIITFANILKWNVFPLAPILSDLVSYGRKGLGCEVEMEFAANVSMDNSVPPTFYILQIRPLITHSEEPLIDPDQVTNDDLICTSNICLGNGIYSDISDIILVKLSGFNSSLTQTIASEISQFNKKFNKDHGYMLIGPGRWGSADPLLGIPVNWNDISNVKSIIEVGLPTFHVDPSFGSHFFQNLTSLNISYFVTSPKDYLEVINWEWLNSVPVEQETQFLKHIKLDDSIKIQVNGKNGFGIALKPSYKIEIPE